MACLIDSGATKDCNYSVAGLDILEKDVGYIMTGLA